MHPTNERWPCNVSSSLIGCTHTQTDPWVSLTVWINADCGGIFLIRICAIISYWMNYSGQCLETACQKKSWLTAPNMLYCINAVHVRWLTHWVQDKMAAILQTIFSNAFFWRKMYEFRFKFHWSVFLRVQLTTFQHKFYSDHGWAPARQQAIIWTGDGYFTAACIYASLNFAIFLHIIPRTNICYSPHPHNSRIHKFIHFISMNGKKMSSMCFMFLRFFFT